MSEVEILNKAVMGRPTKYGDHILEQAQFYLENYENTGRDEHLPTIEGLAVFLRISRDTIHRWRNEADKKDFSDIVEELLSTQALLLLNRGLNNTYNASTAKLMLTKHDYVEKRENENKNTDAHNGVRKIFLEQGFTEKMTDHINSIVEDE